MFKQAKILLVTGSTRQGSLNTKLLAACAAFLKPKAQVTIVTAEQLDLPLFNQDLETAVPAKVLELKQLFQDHDSLVFSCPEYNGSMTPVLVNTIAWMSRSYLKDETMYKAFSGKPCLIVSCSPGALGGLRGVRHLRELLTNMNAIVLPNAPSIGSAYKSFGPDGSIIEESQKKMLETALAEFLKMAHTSANQEEFCRQVKQQGQYGNLVQEQV